MKELEPKKQEPSFFNCLIGGSFADSKLGIDNKWQALQVMNALNTSLLFHWDLGYHCETCSN